MIALVHKTITVRFYRRATGGAAVNLATPQMYLKCLKPEGDEFVVPLGSVVNSGTDELGRKFIDYQVDYHFSEGYWSAGAFSDTDADLVSPKVLTFNVSIPNDHFKRV